MLKPVIFVVALLALTIPDEPTSVTVKTIETIQMSVGPVVCLVTNAKGEMESKQVMGTGFFINRQGDFLTAGHVITQGWYQISTKKNPCIPVIYVSRIPWGDRATDRPIQWFRFRLKNCRYNKEGDLASCRTDLNPFANEELKANIQPVAFSEEPMPPDGTPLAFTGFPLGYLIPITSKGNLATYTAVDKRLIIDKPAWPGASGSPVYIEGGKVIGLIVRRGTNEGAGLAYARPTSVILDFLRTNKIPIEK